MSESFYMAWDRELTDARLSEAVSDEADPQHDELLSLLLREAPTELVWRFTLPQHVAAHLPRIAARLGRREAFWVWLIAEWRRVGLVD